MNSPDTVCSEWDGWADTSTWMRLHKRLLSVTGDEPRLPVTELTLHLVWVDRTRTVIRATKTVLRSNREDPSLWSQVLAYITQKECGKYKLTDTLVFAVPVCIANLGGIELMNIDAVAAEYSQILTSGDLRARAAANVAFPDQLRALPRPTVVSLLTEVQGETVVRMAPRTRKKTPLYLGGKQF